MNTAEKIAVLEQYKLVADCIIWDGQFPYWTKKLSNRQWVGKLAGSITKAGYRLIPITHNGTVIKLLAHRLRWFMENGKIPTMIDHIDRVKDNNNIDNLRECTYSQNSMNRDLQKNKTSKFKGVSWSNLKNKWVAQISINGKTKSLGRFKIEQDAANAWDKAVIDNDLQDFQDLNAVLSEKVAG